MANEFQLQIGVASVDITPPVGIRLIGYAPRVSTSVAHAQRAEAIAVKGPNGTQWAVITSDLLGHTAPFVKAVREKIAATTPLKGEAVMVSATHTHSGGPTVELDDSEMNDLEKQYMADLEEKFVALVAAAYKDLKPGRFEVAWTKAPTLGTNRRIQLPDGSWFNEWRDPEGKHTGYFDPGVLIVAVRRPDGSCPAMLINYGVHPVVLGGKSPDISADYVGYMKDDLEAAGVTDLAMFAIAGGANINPRHCIKIGEEYPRAMGEALGKIVREALGQLKRAAATPVAAARHPWNLVRTHPYERATNQPNMGVGQMIETEIQAFRAGDVAFLAIPGELFSEYAAIMRRQSPAAHTVILSLANDYIGYLPTNKAMAEAAYEAKHSPANDIESPLLEATSAALAAIGK